MPTDQGDALQRLPGCGAEWWIADELWRMSQNRSQENRARFAITVARMIYAGEPKRRTFHRPRREQVGVRSHD